MNCVTLNTQRELDMVNVRSLPLQCVQLRDLDLRRHHIGVALTRFVDCSRRYGTSVGATVSYWSFVVSFLFDTSCLYIENCIELVESLPFAHTATESPVRLCTLFLVDKGITNAHLEQLVPFFRAITHKKKLVIRSDLLTHVPQIVFEFEQVDLLGTRVSVDHQLHHIKKSLCVLDVVSSNSSVRSEIQTNRNICEKYTVEEKLLSFIHTWLSNLDVMSPLHEQITSSFVLRTCPSVLSCGRDKNMYRVVLKDRNEALALKRVSPLFCTSIAL